MLPLSGRAGAPLKLATRANSIVLNAKLDRSENLKFSTFKANQYKETLPLKPQQQFHTLETPMKFTKQDSYTDAPIIQSTLSSGFNKAQEYKPSVNHFTSTLSHWRAVKGLDSPHEKQDNLNKTNASYFSPTKLSVPSEEMARSFTNYDAFKRDLSPGASKVDYRNFLTTV